MRYPEILKIIEDRLRIKSTHIRKRRIKEPEVGDFFRKKQKKLDDAYKNYTEEIDEIIKEYLNENTHD